MRRVKNDIELYALSRVHAPGWRPHAYPRRRGTNGKIQRAERTVPDHQVLRVAPAGLQTRAERSRRILEVRRAQCRPRRKIRQRRTVPILILDDKCKEVFGVVIETGDLERLELSRALRVRSSRCLRCGVEIAPVNSVLRVANVIQRGGAGRAIVAGGGPREPRARRAGGLDGEIG